MVAAADALELMYCTLNYSFKAMSIALDRDHVTYAYGSLNKAPDLALRTSVAKTDYRLSAMAGCRQFNLGRVCLWRRG